MNGVLGDVVARQRTTMTVAGTQLWRFDGDQLNVTEGWVAPVFGDGQYGVVCMLFDRQTLDVERMTATARELGPLLPRISSARDG